LAKVQEKQELQEITFAERLEEENETFSATQTPGGRSITFNPKKERKSSGGNPQRERRSASRSKLSGK
jgi:hypothetical protein